jgi:hypothetical protein
MKITSEDIRVDISVSCFIKADRLIMYHCETGETKPYSKIEENDLENWIVEDSGQVIRDSEMCENSDINLWEVEY